MRKIILLIIVLCLKVSIAQEKEQRYPYDGKKFRKKIENEFLRREGKKKSRKLAKDLYKIHKNLPSEKSKKEFIDLMNLLYERRIFGYTNYRNLANSIDKIKKMFNRKEDIILWLNNYLRMLQKATPNSSKRIFNLNNSISKRKIIPKNKIIEWGIKQKGDMKFINDSTQKFSLDNVEIFCRYDRNKYLYIKEVTGVLDLEKTKLYINKAKIDWSRLKISSKDQYANIFNDTINLEQNYYTSKKATFYSKIIGYYDIKGKITHRVFNKTDNRKKIEFESFSGIEKKHLSGRYSYKGVMKVENGEYYMVNDEISKEQAQLYIYKQGKKIVKIFSNRLNIDKEKITSNDLFFEIKMPDSTSISSVLQRMVFDFKNKVLFFEKKKLGSKNKSHTPTNNSYHKMSIKASKVYWNIDSTKIYITSSDDNTVMISDDYYIKGIHKKFRGLNKKNPLEKLDDMIEVYDKLEFTLDEIASYLNTTVSSLYYILVEISKLGYLSVDIEGNRVVFFEKFKKLEKFKMKSIDNDNMVVEKRDKKSILKIDINTGKMSTIYTSKVGISLDENVSMYPYEGRLDIKFNRNIFMPEGSFTVGGYSLWGDSTRFSYKDYKINIEGTQTLSISIPDIKSKSSKERNMKEIINRIEGVRGEVVINELMNKSSRIDSINDKYPIFSTYKKSYIYYDNPIFQKGVYDRKRFFIEVSPFRKDSLIKNTTHKKLYFDADVHTEIMPVFKEKIKIQKDYSLGFIRKTPDEGFPIYGGKGNFSNLVVLSSKGLKGIGTLKYSVSTSETEDLTFFLDSLKAKTTKFNIEETVNDRIDVPSVSHKIVDIKWDILKDTMILSSETPFDLYDKLMKNEGSLKLTNNDLTGRGSASLKNGKITAEQFSYNSKSFFSDKLNFSLRENNKSPYEFFIDDAYGEIDIVNQKGNFYLNNKDAVIEIKPVEFKAYVKNAVWDMNSTSVTMTAEKDSLGKFEAIDSEQEGFEFKAGKAVYNLRTKSLNSENVEDINVSDIVITPNESKIEILRGGKVKKMEKAFFQVLNNKKEVIHQIKNANITISSGKRYKAEGTYLYIDRDRKEQEIKFSELYSDITFRYKTRGKGYVNRKQKFSISDKFKFHGNTYIIPNNKRLKFQGFTEINNNCNKKNLKIGKVITINSFVDVINPKLKIGNPEEGRKAETVYSGILSPEDKELDFNAVYLENDSIENKDIYILNKIDEVRYNYEKKCYEGTTKSNNYKSLFYDEECKLGIEGEIRFNNMGKSLELEGFADMEQNLENKEVFFNDLLFTINFEFEEDILEEIVTEFNYKDTLIDRDTTFKRNIVFDSIVEKVTEKLKDIKSVKNEETGKMEMKIVERDTIIDKIKIIPKTVVDTIIKEIITSRRISKGITGENKAYRFFQAKNSKKKNNFGRALGIGKKIDESLRRGLLVNNLKMKWNNETKCFYSEGDNVEIIQLGEELFGKKLEGKFEIQRDRVSDIITLYFKNPHSEDYYFFRFSKNRVNFLTNNEEIMGIYKELKEKENNIRVINGVEYEMRIPSDLTMRAFLLKYY